MKVSLAAKKAFREAIESDEIASHMEEYDGLCLACVNGNMESVSLTRATTSVRSVASDQCMGLKSVS
jgi:hypothetical protein